MPFILNAGTNVDKQQLLGEILQRDSFEDKSAFEKTKIILNNSLHGWENVVDGVKELVSDEVVDSEFVNEIGAKGNLDLAKEYGININNTQLLRDSKNRDEFDERLERIKVFEKEEREAGFVSQTSDVWATANVASNILADPLLIPSITIPSLALARLNTVGRVIGGAMIDTTLYSVNDTLQLLATHQKRDKGEVVGDLLMNGFLGGATGLIPNPKSAREVKEVEDNLIDWTADYINKKKSILSKEISVNDLQTLNLTQKETLIDDLKKELSKNPQDIIPKEAIDSKEIGEIPFSLSGGVGVGAVLALMTSMDAEASDGERDLTFMDAVIAIGLGYLAYKNRKGLAQIKQRASEKLKSKKDIKGIDLSPKQLIGLIGGTKQLTNKVKNLDTKLYKNTKRLHAKLFENIEALMSKGARKEAVSQTKEIARNKVLGGLISKVSPLLKEHFEEIGFKSLNPIKHVQKRVEFYEGIGRAYTTKNFDNLTKAQKQAVEHFDSFFDNIKNMLKRAGVEGIEDMEELHKYFPRFHKPQTYDFVSTLSKNDLKAVEDWYADAIYRGFLETGEAIEEDTARKFAKRLLRSGRSDNYYDILREDELFTGSPNDTDDFFNRAKFRIPIDFTVKPIKVGDRLLEMSDFVETDAFAVVNRYANMSLGHYAFAKAGIPNINNYTKHVKEEFIEHGGDKRVLQDLLDYTNSILGRPISDISDSGLHDFFSLLSKATSTQLLHLSGLSALSEVVTSGAKALLSGTYGEALRTFRKTSKEMLDKNIDSITDEIANLTGYGEKRIIGKETVAMPKVNIGDDFTVGGKWIDKIDTILTAQQRVTFFLNQLPALEDFTNIMTLKSNHMKLSDHIHGRKAMNERRLETIGLKNDADLKILGGLFKEKITNKSLNIHKWTEDEKRIYTNVIRAMQKGTTGQVVMGDIPLFIQKSPMLKALTTLLSFPIQSFDNLLLRDLYARDAESIFRFQTMLVGTAMSILIRDQLNNREYKSDTEFYERVIQGMPHFAMMNIAKQVLDPNSKVRITNIFPSLSVLENALNVPQSTLEGDYRPLLQTLSVPIFMGKLLNETAKEPTTNQQAIEQLSNTIGGLR